MIKTTNTGSPKVKKVTSTQPKKRGRPVGSKKVKHQIPSLVKIMSDDEIDKMLNSKKALEKEKKFLDDYYRWELHEDEAIPDSEATVEIVNKYKEVQKMFSVCENTKHKVIRKEWKLQTG